VGKQIFLLLINLAIGSFAHAQQEDCSRIRLDESQGPLIGVPAIHQGNLKHCANITAALMLTAYLRQSHPDLKNFIVAPEKILSQILASNPKDQEKLLSATMGRTCMSIELLKKTGACDRRELRKVLRSVAETKLHRKADHEEVDFILDEMMRKFEKLMSERKAPLSTDDAVYLRNSMKEMGIPIESLPSDKTILASENGYQLLDSVFDKACHGGDGWLEGSRINSSSDGAAGPSCKMFDFVKQEGKQRLETPESFKGEIHRLLNQPKDDVLPVGIAYCSGVLLQPKREFIKNRVFPLDVDHLNGPKAQENLSRSCKFHASAIIGRERQRDGKCYFLIQNSWGASCSPYNTANRCENGKVWVEENALSRNILRIIHLNK
jgi:hypothetical protein